MDSGDHTLIQPKEIHESSGLIQVFWRDTIALTHEQPFIHI